MPKHSRENGKRKVHSSPNGVQKSASPQSGGLKLANATVFDSTKFLKRRKDRGASMTHKRMKKTVPENGPEPENGMHKKAAARDSDAERKSFADIVKTASLPDADSSEVAASLFAKIIAPTTLEEFYRDYYQKKPLLIRRRDPKYYAEWFSMQHVKTLLNEGLEWNLEVDCTSYKNQVRQTHNGEGEADPDEVWGKYADGCSVRLLRPQRRLDGVCRMLALLDEHWGSCSGANVYLTPAGSQGFAPHWDDIEAFILQTEGVKHWQVYPPRSEEERLPRFSSNNLSQDELPPPILECSLHPGDLLYFPRGYIHQAKSDAAKHSLHVTVSYGYRNSWYDFLKAAMNGALERAASMHVQLREDLPRDYTTYVGVPYLKGPASKKRDRFTAKAKALVNTVLEELDVGVALGADERARSWLHQRLPPAIPDADEDLTNPEEDVEEALSAQRTETAEGLTPRSRVRLLRRGVARLNVEGELAVLYHCVDNARDFQGKEEQCLEFDVDYLDAIQHLIDAYPAYTKVQDLPVEGGEEEALELAVVLARAGVIVHRG